MKRIIIYLPLLAFLACMSKDVQEIKPKLDSKPLIEESEQILAKETEMGGATSSTLPDKLGFNGIIEIPPQSQASITLLMGGRVKATFISEGKFVKKGEVLAVIENMDFIDLQQAFLESDAQMEFLETEYLRQQVLASEEVASRKKLQQSKADYFSMKSRRDASSAQLVLLGIDPSKIRNSGIMPAQEVRSPIDGYVTDVHINIGKNIEAGSALCDVISKKDPILNLTLYEKDISRIREGDRIEFKINSSDQVFFGRVIYLGQVVDQISRSLSVYAKIDKYDPLFRSGMYVNAKFIANRSAQQDLP